MWNFFFEVPFKPCQTAVILTSESTKIEAFRNFPLGTIRRFLEHYGDTVERVVFVVGGTNEV